MKPTTEIESFYVEGNKAGALIRCYSPRVIESTLVFKAPRGPVVHLFQRTCFETTIFRWSEYTFIDHLENIAMEVQATERAPGDGTEPAIPSYAAYLVLKDFLKTDEPRQDFRQFNESAPSGLTPAAFVRTGIEAVETPYGSRDALKVVLQLDGHDGNTFWCADGAVVKSDWQGAESFATADAAVVLGSLDADVQTLLESALANVGAN